MADDGVSAGPPVETDHLEPAERLQDATSSPTKMDTDIQNDATKATNVSEPPKYVQKALVSNEAHNESAPVYVSIAAG